MFATFETRSPDDLAAEPSFVEGYTLVRLGDNRATTFALWSTTADPMAYLVEDSRRGTAAEEAPGAASVIWFDGPMSPARVAAARFAFRERIGPVLAGLPGLVRMLVLWRERDAASCAVTFAVDLSTLESAAAAVNSTGLLAEEDPALLTGPDRVEIHHTADHTVAVTRTSQGVTS